MSDKDFWTEVYLYAIKEYITKHGGDVDLLEKFEDKFDKNKIIFYFLYCKC